MREKGGAIGIILGNKYCLHGFCISKFNHPWIENIQKKKSYIVTDVYYIVSPRMVASIPEVSSLLDSLDLTGIRIVVGHT